MYRLLCARMVLAGEFVVGTGCIGAAKERRNDDEVCERTSSPATLKPGAKVQSCLRGLWYLLISADLPLIKVYYTPAHVTVRSVFGGTLLVVLRPKVTPKSDSSPPNFLGLICRQKKKVQRSISLDCRCGSLFKDSSIFFLHLCFTSVCFQLLNSTRTGN